VVEVFWHGAPLAKPGRPLAEREIHDLSYLATRPATRHRSTNPAGVAPGAARIAFEEQAGRPSAADVGVGAATPKAGTS
jgi:hypothetical protein